MSRPENGWPGRSSRAPRRPRRNGRRPRPSGRPARRPRRDAASARAAERAPAPASRTRQPKPEPGIVEGVLGSERVPRVHPDGRSRDRPQHLRHRPPAPVTSDTDGGHRLRRQLGRAVVAIWSRPATPWWPSTGPSTSPVDGVTGSTAGTVGTSTIWPRRSHGCSALIHLAAIPAPYGHPHQVVFGNNVTATFAALQAAADAKITRVVIASSGSAYGTAFSPRAEPSPVRAGGRRPPDGQRRPVRLVQGGGRADSGDVHPPLPDERGRAALSLDLPIAGSSSPPCEGQRQGVARPRRVAAGTVGLRRPPGRRPRVPVGRRGGSPAAVRIRADAHRGRRHAG